MLAEAQDEIPDGPGWRYEPKWDGFRGIVFRDGDTLAIQSREGKPLARYFPEVVAALKSALPPQCIIDGEIILAGPRGLEFDTLQQRLHPAASRINTLAAETPASFVVFDLLALGSEDWRGTPFGERRARCSSAGGRTKRSSSRPRPPASPKPKVGFAISKAPAAMASSPDARPSSTGPASE